MKFGVCTKAEALPQIQAAGYDYYEGNLNKLATMNEQEYDQLSATLQKLELPMETTAVFFGKDCSLIGDNTDFDAIAAYADHALARAAKLGAKLSVLGSGAARKIPDGFPREQAEEQFVKIMRICGDAAQKYGMKIALEPLNPTETNLVNSVSEGLALCKKAHHPAVGLLVDFYHAFMVNDDLTALEEAGEWLLHAHIARPNADRAAPTAQDRETLIQWANTLKKCGYNERLTLECKFTSTIEQGLADMNSVKEIFS